MTDTTDKPEFPKRPSTASGTDIGWSVEVRLADYKEPFPFLGMMLTNKWKKFEVVVGQIEDSPLITVPHKPSFYGTLERERLLEYPAAQSLRWSLHAHFDIIDRGSGLALESRLVRHELTYAFTCTPEKALEYISGEDRSSIMPNWNMKEGDTFTFVDGKLVKNKPAEDNSSRGIIPPD